MRVRLEAWPSEVIIDVDLPAGYHRVFSGALKPGDLYLHLGELRQGRTVWHPVKLDDPLRMTAGWYTCVIRPGDTPAQEACERCGCEARAHGQRYCRGCAKAILREQQADTP
jgi:hypothetical protein